jgi:seryl-tRNA synthetase
MLDIKLIRESPKIVEDNLKKRGMLEKIDFLKELIEKDTQRRDIIKELEELRHKHNVLIKEVAILKAGGKDVTKKLAEACDIPKNIKELEKELGVLNEWCNNALMNLPNILHESVPIGKDDGENVEIKKWGLVPRFDFQPKNHFELAVGLGLIDSENAAKVSGHGFFFLKKELALLDYALQRFALDFLTKKGFVAIEPPFMINRKAYEGMIDPNDFETVTYKIDNEDLYLIATSEHPMGAMLMNETLLKEDLPMMFAGISSCFRKEVGAHGKYTRGLFRMHQFNKIEQFIFCMPEDSWRLHEELQKNSEELWQALEIPYRVVNVCTGDIGNIAAKKYDTEFWMTDGQYREMGSNSNCTDYQARRLNIKWREKEGKAPGGFVHTLNNTAIATSRAMVAILELGQQADGSIKLPRALWSYTGFKEIVKK